MRVYKYEFAIDDYVTIKMPVGAKILKVEIQKTVPCLWACVMPDAETEDRHFRIYGTGQDIDEKEAIKHIATFQEINYDASFVWHFFEIIK